MQSNATAAIAPVEDRKFGNCNSIIASYRLRKYKICVIDSSIVFHYDII